MDRIFELEPEARCEPLLSVLQNILSRMPGRAFRLSSSEAEHVLRGCAADVEWLVTQLGHDPFDGLSTPVGSLDWDAPDKLITLIAKFVLETARARLVRDDDQPARPQILPIKR